ncbi:MAG: dienelactone hydrolase family protein [Nocardiaceae bacterium]|nr:dienelactone hydrolase family protein [Nocardiaceae bacterium]
MPTISYRTGDFDLPAYLAVPDGPGPFPGVVVIHDATGFQGDVEAQAERMAAHGYIAIAPSLYSRGVKPLCVVKTFAASQAGRGQAFEDIDNARKLLLARPDCTGKVGIIGFCMGGNFAMQSAHKLDFDAASVNYGEVPFNAEKLEGSCPVVGSFGGKDRYLWGAAERLEKHLTKLGVPHDVKEYPTVGHSFLNDLPAVARSPFLPVNVVMGFHGTDDAAVADAWKRIFGFFGEHLS